VDHAREEDGIVLRHHLRERGAGEAPQLLAVGVERVAAQVEAETQLLVLQPLALAPRRRAHELHRLGRFDRAAEKRRLLRELRAVLGGLARRAERGEYRGAIRLDGIERGSED